MKTLLLNAGTKAFIFDKYFAIDISKDVVCDFLILHLHNDGMALYKKLTNTGLYILKNICVSCVKHGILEALLQVPRMFVCQFIDKINLTV